MAHFYHLCVHNNLTGAVQTVFDMARIIDGIRFTNNVLNLFKGANHIAGLGIFACTWTKYIRGALHRKRSAGAAQKTYLWNFPNLAKLYIFLCALGFAFVLDRLAPAWLLYFCRFYPDRNQVNAIFTSEEIKVMLIPNDKQNKIENDEIKIEVKILLCRKNVERKTRHK